MYIVQKQFGYEITNNSNSQIESHSVLSSVLVRMKIYCGVLLVLLVVTDSIAIENAFDVISNAESPESLAARSYEQKDCQKDTHEGVFVCMALFWRYRWSDKDEECVKAVYGGCHATKNNFITKEDCEAVAGPICRRN